MPLRYLDASLLRRASATVFFFISGLRAEVLWRLPVLARADHVIDNREQLPHAGDERHFLRLACGEESVIKGFEHRIAAGAHQGSHVEHRADRSASAVNRAAPPPAARVPVERCDADEL